MRRQLDTNRQHKSIVLGTDNRICPGEIVFFFNISRQILSRLRGRIVYKLFQDGKK